MPQYITSFLSHDYDPDNHDSGLLKSMSSFDDQTLEEKVGN